LLKRIVSEVMLTLLFIGMLTLAFGIQPARASGTIYIRADGSVEGTDKIQQDGDIYTFTDNIYDEIVVERSNIVIDGNGYTLHGPYEIAIGTGFRLWNVNNVTIRNVTITGFYDGISLYESSYNIISGNNITENTGHGVELIDSHDNLVSGNSITECTSPHAHAAVSLGRSFYNIILGNNITNNDWDCVWLGSSSHNTITGNNMTNNARGIYLYQSYYNTITANEISDNAPGCGIRFELSSKNSVSGNNITNSVCGIALLESSDNTISGNNIAKNRQAGIYLSKSSDNTIYGNNVTNTYGKGMYIERASDNFIYHNNFVNNTNQVYIYTSDSVNVWNNSYPSGGNYWSDYTGIDLYSGPYQNETGSDGIGDTPYVIDENNQDNYPLMNHWTPTPQGLKQQ